MIYKLDYDLIKFGNILLQIRQNRRYTQTKVRRLTGVHPDTIKGLEYGQRFPTIDTLNKLSDLYQVNLLNILTECKHENESYLQKIKEQINTISYLDDVNKIDELLEKLELYNKQYMQTLHPKVEIIINQLKCFSKIIKIKNKRDIMNVLEVERLCYEALQMYHNHFNENRLDENYYSILEVRILIALAMSKARQDKPEQAISIAEFSHKQFLYHFLSDKSLLPFVLQGYFALSYLYFIADDFKKTISICDSAIEFAKKQYTTRYLAQYYFRKGIAQYYLKAEHYECNLRTSIKYLLLNNEHELAEKYKQVLRDQYSIDLDSVIASSKKVK